MKTALRALGVFALVAGLGVPSGSVEAGSGRVDREDTRGFSGSMTTCFPERGLGIPCLGIAIEYRLSSFGPDGQRWFTPEPRVTVALLETADRLGGFRTLDIPGFADPSRLTFEIDPSLRRVRVSGLVSFLGAPEVPVEMVIRADRGVERVRTRVVTDGADGRPITVTNISRTATASGSIDGQAARWDPTFPTGTEIFRTIVRCRTCLVPSPSS